MSQPATAGDPVFAIAARVAARQREYEARSEYYHQECCRLAKPFDDARFFRVSESTSNEEFARGWAVTFVNAWQAVVDAQLPELLQHDPNMWIPGQLARAALRAGGNGQEAAEHAAHSIAANTVHGPGVRSELGKIGDQFSKRIRERYEAALKEEFQDIAADGSSPPTPDQFEQAEQLARAAADLQSLAAEFCELGEELRGRLNAVLSSGRRWEALFDVGPHIPGPAYEQSRIRVFAAEGGVSPAALARVALERLIEFAVRQDRPGFDAMLAKMRASSAVTTEAEARFPEDILRLLTGLYKHRRAEFRQRADAILAPLGTRLMETHTADRIRTAGIAFPQEAEFALNYWVDPIRDVVWFDRDGEQLLPFGSCFPHVNSPSEGEKSEEEKVSESHAVSNSQPVLTSADLEELRLLASNKLKKHQKKAVLLLCERGGCVPLREVAETCEWVTATQVRLKQPVDCDGRWNSLRNRLNKQRDLKSAGWNFYTLDKDARVQKTAVSARK